MEKKFIIRIKINTANCFNNVINAVNDLQEKYENLELPTPLATIDIQFEILLGYLRDIATRSIELNDATLLRLCEEMSLIVTEPKKEAG